MNRTQQPLADVVAVENSPDGLVEVTAGVFGELRWLRLDPRINRVPDAAGPAATILAAQHTAARRAARSVSDVDGHDLAFDPVLDRIDGQPADPRPTDPDGRPVLAGYVDYAGLRRYLLRMRDELARLRETAVSRDGLITVTVGGRCGLLGLTLDSGIYRAHGTAELAGQILATARRAAGQVADRLSAISAAITEGAR